MIKFVHKKHYDREKGKAKIIITYSFFEIILGILLLFTNISAMVLIYEYTQGQQNQYYSGGVYPSIKTMSSQTRTQK